MKPLKVCQMELAYGIERKVYLASDVDPIITECDKLREENAELKQAIDGMNMLSLEHECMQHVKRLEQENKKLWREIDIIAYHKDRIELKKRIKSK